jgi:hypothetical protein
LGGCDGESTPRRGHFWDLETGIIQALLASSQGRHTTTPSFEYLERVRVLCMAQHTDFMPSLKWQCGSLEGRPMDDEKDREIANLKRSLESSTRVLSIYKDMFTELQETVSEVLTEIDDTTEGGEPIAEGDKSRFELLQKFFVIMASAIDKIGEARNGDDQ